MFFPDFIYSMSLYQDGNFLRTTAEALSEEKFKGYLDLSFDEQYKQDVCQLAGVEPRPAINAMPVLGDIARYCAYSHTYGEYEIKRGITEEQAGRYKIGSLDNFAKADDDTKNFIEGLFRKYSGAATYCVLKYFNEIIGICEKAYGECKMITVPSFDSAGLCRGIVFRNISHKPSDKVGYRNLYKFFITNPATYLFNFTEVDRFDTLYVVEGVFDKLAMERAGIENVISPSANRLSKYHFDLLKDKQLIFIFDKDLGGLNGLRYMLDRNPYKNIKGMALCPEKDLDEMEKEQIWNFLKEEKLA